MSDRFTPDESVLLRALVTHFRLDIQRQLASREARLTPDGRAKYQADDALAEACLRKIHQLEEMANE